MHIKYFIYFLLGIISFYLLFNEKVEGLVAVECSGTVGIGKYKDSECSEAYDTIKGETTLEGAMSWCAGAWQQRTGGCELKGEPQCNGQGCPEEYTRRISQDGRIKANEWCVAKTTCNLGPFQAPSNSNDSSDRGGLIQIPSSSDDITGSPVSPNSNSEAVPPPVPSFSDVSSGSQAIVVSPNSSVQIPSNSDDIPGSSNSDDIPGSSNSDDIPGSTSQGGIVFNITTTTPG